MPIPDDKQLPRFPRRQARAGSSSDSNSPTPPVKYSRGRAPDIDVELGTLRHTLTQLRGELTSLRHVCAARQDAARAQEQLDEERFRALKEQLQRLAVADGAVRRAAHLHQGGSAPSSPSDASHVICKPHRDIYVFVN